MESISLIEENIIKDKRNLFRLNYTAIKEIFLDKKKKLNQLKIGYIRARSLVVSDLFSETKGSRFESGCYLCAEMSSVW